MRWFSLQVDNEPVQIIAASDLVGAVIWVWDNGHRDAKTITIRELVDEPPLSPEIMEVLNARGN